MRNGKSEYLLLRCRTTATGDSGADHGNGEPNCSYTGRYELEDV